MHSDTTHLPNELWFEIFKDISKSDLRNASLTCRHFHSLAKPLIFRSVHLTWIYKDIARQTARFNFYSSDVVAPFVREFAMSGWISIVSGPQNIRLLSKIVDAIPRFINIQSFSCLNFAVTMAQVALQQMSRLPSLKRVVVIDCHVPPKTPPLPMLRPRAFECITDSRGTLDLEAHKLLAFLDLDHLQVLRITLTEGLCSSFPSGDNPSPYLFPSLHTVNLDVNDETPLFLPRFLSKTPALRSLKLGRFESYARPAKLFDGIMPPTYCATPYLEEYRGPHQLLPIILGRETGFPSVQLRRLLVENASKVGDPLIAFMGSFKSCPPLSLSALTHLRISMLGSMRIESLAELPDMFPVLQEFYLHASEDHYSSAYTDLTDLYAVPLPSTLVSLSIEWTSGYGEAVPDLKAAKDNLLPRLPHLRRLWLADLSEVVLLWNQTASRSEERCHPHESRSGWRDDMWAMRRVVFPESSFFQL